MGGDCFVTAFLTMTISTRHREKTDLSVDVAISVAMFFSMAYEKLDTKINFILM